MSFAAPVWSPVAGALTVTGGGGRGVANPSLVRGDFPGAPVLRASRTAKLAPVSAVRHASRVRADAGKVKGLSTNPGRFHERS